jgi:competence protein ComEC
MLAFDPLVAFDASFVLSALATLGLIFLAPPLASRLSRRWLPAIVARPLAATVAASLACAPVLASMAPQLPLAGLAANLIAIPIGEAAALPLCILHVFLASWPDAERGCALAASGALHAVRWVAHAFAVGGVPVPLPTTCQTAALTAGVATAAVARRPWLALTGTLAALIGFEAIARTPPRGRLRATFPDVAQGDSALVDFPDGSLMLVDGGGLVGSPVDVGERVLVPVLRVRRRSAIDVVVLTHPHPDHFLGLRTALSAVDVGAFWDTGQGEAEGTAGAYAELLASLRGRGVRIVRPPSLCGSQSFGGARVDVLAPCPGPSSDDGPNDNSFVLAIRHGRRAILFAGDAERTLEDRLVRDHGPALRADVLKVGHHGSSTSSTPSFLAAVAPEIAVISSGVRNRFGHPHPVTIAALAAIDARVFRTDRDGAIVVESDGDSLQVRSTTPM